MVASWAELGVKPASALTAAVAGRGTDRFIAVEPSLRGLLPDGLPRGATVAVTGKAAGRTSLLLGLLSRPSRAGSWCAAVCRGCPWPLGCGPALTSGAWKSAGSPILGRVCRRTHASLTFRGAPPSEFLEYMRVVRGRGCEDVVAEMARLRAIVKDTDPRHAVGDGLPLLEPLRPLLAGRLRRGAVVAIDGEAGRTSLAMAMLAGVSTAGGWCGVVGVPSFGCLAGSELGVRLERLALVPQPGADWVEVVSVLITGFEAVLVAPPAPVSGNLARRLGAKARQHRCALFTLGQVWEGSDLRLSVLRQDWLGLGQQGGRLRKRRLTVVASDRPHAGLDLWLPFEDGGVSAIADKAPLRPSGVGRSGDPTVVRSLPAAVARGA